MELTLQKPIAARTATGALFFVMGAGFASWASRIPDIQERLNLNAAQLGGILIGMPVGSLLSLLVTGALVTRLGSRTVALVTMLLYAATLPAIGWASSAWQLMAVLFVFGTCGNILNISLNTQGVGIESLWGKPILSSFHGLWSLGAMAGAAFGGLMVSQGTVPFQHFLLVGSVILASGLIAYRFMLRTDRQPDEKQPLFALPDRPLMLLGLIAFGCMLTEGAMADWSGIYYKQTLHGLGVATTGYTAFTFTMAVGRFGGDGLAARFGIRILLQVSGLLIALGLGLALLLPIPAVVVTGFMLVGLGVASVVPLVYSVAGRSQTMSAGLALTAVSTVGYTGFLLGPPLIGFLAEAFSLRRALLVVVVLGVVITALAGRVKTRG
ncbi:MAG: MFS transporter [Cytophagaceae bacterium]|nr:MFS transporter [Cytophagaceae bacterium]